MKEDSEGDKSDFSAEPQAIVADLFKIEVERSHSELQQDKKDGLSNS